jgi:hypothetical protein
MKWFLKEILGPAPRVAPCLRSMHEPLRSCPEWHLLPCLVRVCSLLVTRRAHVARVVVERRHLSCLVMAVKDKGGRVCCRAGTEWALTGRPKPDRRPMGGRTRRRKTLVDSKECMNEEQLWPRDSGSACEA